MFRQIRQKVSIRFGHLVAGFLASTLSLSAQSLSYASPAPAGSLIENRAEASYFNERLGTFETVQSNAVIARVLPVPALEISGGQDLRLARSSSNQYNFRTENVGNITLSTSFDAEELAGDDFDLSGQLHIDNNNNGIIDSGDFPLASGQTVMIDVGEQISLIYTFNTPATVSQDDVATTMLTTTAIPVQGAVPIPVSLDPIVETTEARTIIDDAGLLLIKSAAVRSELGEIDYRIIARNNAETALPSYNEVDGEPLLIDGQLADAILVRDPIPLNTTLKSAEDGGAFNAVYHVRGEATHSYTRTLPSDLSSVDAVAFVHEGDFAVGRSSDLEFTVTISPTIENDDIFNTATGYVSDGTATLSLDSNAVVSSVSGPGQTISFVNIPGGTPIQSTPFDRNILLTVSAGSCNVSDAIDEISVTVTTTSLGDLEILTARETGANAGVFETAPIGAIRANAAIQQNNVLEGLPGDNAGANATATCLGSSLSTSIGLQPGGFVFDSVTNAPVSGARVVVFSSGDTVQATSSLLPEGAGFVAETASLTGNSQITESVTDALGYFDFGTISRGDYRLEIFPPSNYAFPSVRRAFDGFQRRIDEEISFGTDFTFNGGPIVNFDVPLDPAVGIPLTIAKTSDRQTARRGGFVIYTLTANNQMDQALLNASVVDQLPPGLLFIEGSARRDGESFDVAPTLTSSGQLTFDLDIVGPNTSTVITYGVRVGTATRQGDKVNVAALRGQQAGTGLSFVSPQARSTITIDDRGGVFADEAIVIGRVFLDKNGDGIQTKFDAEGNPHNEPGVPGVKIVTSDGLSVVTDSEGKYSLFGLRPTTAAFAIQSSTLPKSAIHLELDVDDIHAPGSRLVDLKRGELRAEHFPLVWSAEAEADVAARRRRFNELDADESLLRDDLPLTFDTVTRNSSRRETGIDTKTELLTEDVRQDSQSNHGDLDIIKTPIEELVKDLDPELAFVGITTGHEADRQSISVRVKGPTKGRLRLEVNGEEVSESQIGAKVIHQDGGVQVYEYVALRLVPNENTITAIVTDPFGNDRGREEIIVYAPGNPASIVVLVPEEAKADSRARIPVVVRVVDDAGRLVRVPADVTLSAKNGSWDVRDIRDNQHGLQAYISNGEAVFDFIPPDLVGTETIRVETDFASVEAEIGFTPDLNERIFVGVVEGAIKFGEEGSNLDGLISKDEISSFEETTEGVRGQLYLKGTILGENLLTLRYNSDYDTSERLFRDIRRDEFYPVYGDNSERGFDAQSSSSLYVKVEREQSFILYGDIAVEPQADAIRLGAYRRSLTGGRAHIEQGPVTVDLFVAETDEQQQVIEQRGRGVSGPYDFDFDGIREGSEVIEIVTRDRDQPDVIISTLTQSRFSDYTIDFFSGSLIFNRPIPLVDEDLNPVSIRVTFETEEGAGDDYLVYGGEIRVEPIEGVAVGYREVRSDASRELDDRRIVRSGYAEVNSADYGHAQLELAQTEDQFDQRGEAARISYEYRGDKHGIRAEAVRTDENFDAPNSYVGPGREEVRITTDHEITDKASITTDSLYTRNIETDDRRIGAEVRGRYTVSPSLDLVAGGRAVRTTRADGDNNEVYSGIIRADWRPYFLPRSSLNAEFEQDFTETGNWRLSLGGDYQWSPQLRFYALNEISSTESGFFGLGDGADANFTTKVGAEYQVSENVSGFSEYRQTAGLSGDGGAANGVKGQWDLTEHLAIRMSAEHVEPIDTDEDRSSAATLGLTYENDETGLILRHDVEADRDERGLGFFTNTAVGYELNNDLTLLARNRLAYDLRDDNRLRDRLRFGLAYRPEHDTRLKALALYEFEIDDEADLREVAHRWSLGGTYHPTDDLRFNARYSGEYSDISSSSFSADSTLHLLRGGAEVDFGLDFTEEFFGGNRFAVGGHVAAFTDNEGDNVTLGLGVELKANVVKNVQIGVGYNFIDIEEDRLRDLYQSGFYARVRIKLDDSVWDYFDQTGITKGFHAAE